jgi:glycerophosphoryl diester phosphodiesterase
VIRAATTIVALAALAALPPAAVTGEGEPELLGRAILPADAYQPGPPSGAFITPDNGVTPPFPSQPLPGFSAILDAGHGRFWGMPDNGFGSKGNSGDFLLRLYLVLPDFKTGRGGSGEVEVLRFIQLHDPDGRVPFDLYRPDRLLTGADFDIESVRRARDGSLWFGDEFGPFLLHTDADGRVLEAPIPLAGVQSPQNPFLGDPDAWTIRASRGFEGTAISVDRKRLYPVIEGSLRNDPDPRRRIVNEFSLRRGEYTGRTWQYRVDAEFPDAVIGEFTALDEHRFVLIERDDAQGIEARQKKVYLVDLRRIDAAGFLRKRLVLDLLQIRDPHAYLGHHHHPASVRAAEHRVQRARGVEGLRHLAGHLAAVEHHDVAAQLAPALAQPLERAGRQLGRPQIHRQLVRRAQRHPRAVDVVVVGVPVRHAIPGEPLESRRRR